MSDLSKLTNAEFKARLLSAAAIADTMMAGGGFLLREAASRLQAPAVAEVEGMRAEINRLRRLATDRSYMMTAYRQMLGPKGCEVAAMWDAKGVERQHTSWGPKAAEMTGEERAQVHLDIEAQPKTENLDLDGGFPRSRAPRPLRTGGSE